MSINIDDKKFTEEGQAWLSQFAVPDQEIAKLAALYLKLISADEFDNYIKEQIEKYKNKDNVTFYSVKEAEKRENIFELFEASMDDLGSEAKIGNIVRNFCRSNKCLHYPQKKELIETKCREIVLVDDLIGSGTRIYKFLDAFWRSKTIKSWISSGFLKFHVIAYSATEVGLKKIRTHKIKLASDPIYKITCPTFDKLPLEKKNINEIIDIFQRYGKKLRLPEKFWLGYKKSLGALVFTHGCPNNVPAIFWAEKNKWKPLFMQKYVSADIEDNYRTVLNEIKKESIFDILGEKEIETAEPFFTNTEILKVLLLIARGKRKIEMINFATDLSDAESSSLLEKCEAYGFITKERRITKEGRRRLNKSKIKGEKTYLELPIRGEEYYYPKKLR